MRPFTESAERTGLPQDTPEPFDDFEKQERDDEPPDRSRWDWRRMDWVVVEPHCGK